MRRGQALLVCLCGVAVGCGDERQDANEPDRSYDVALVDASFPERQRLGQASELEITVRNDDTETIPDIAVTVGGLYRRLDNPALADRSRPVFVVNSRQREIGGHPEVKLAGPQGGPSSTLDTWTLGRLRPGAQRTFRWRVSAVRPGPFEITYQVAAGIDGKAKAVTRDDVPPRGKFVGTITSEPPPSRIATDGRTVVSPAP